jgi:hypothetical protein
MAPIPVAEICAAMIGSDKPIKAAASQRTAGEFIPKRDINAGRPVSRRAPL